MEIKTRNFRKEHLAIRNAMSEDEVKEKSRQICDSLLHSDWYEEADEIFAYYPLGKEADCRPFLKKALNDGKRIAFPRVKEDFQMDFFYITDWSQLQEGHFHVMEPSIECELALPESQPVLVPGSVFDRQGNRCGYGKGYYDRFFEKYPSLMRNAICYTNQLEMSIPAQPHDIPMHRIYTECGTLKELKGAYANGIT